MNPKKIIFTISVKYFVGKSKRAYPTPGQWITAPNQERIYYTKLDKKYHMHIYDTKLRTNKERRTIINWFINWVLGIGGYKKSPYQVRISILCASCLKNIETIILTNSVPKVDSFHFRSGCSNCTAKFA